MAVTQPRRVAAVSVASRVAEEKNCNLGEEVGYSIRFDECMSEKSKIRFFTDGMLISEIMHRDPMLKNYSVVMVDEAHERSMQVSTQFLTYFVSS